VSSPPESVTVKCPQCGQTYEDWWRPSVNLNLETFDDEYLDACSSAVCPKCGHKVKFDVLTVRGNTFFWSGGAPPNEAV